jgi:HK97 family phage prohead protease
MPLARTGNASLTLREDDRGLAFEATLPATRAADDILELTRSATITGASIGFRIPPGGDVWSSRGDVRQLTRIELVEVSAVALPAYDGTEVHARSLAFIDNRARLRRLRRELL